jgi:sec-independent protein translocase protein TatA
MSLGPVEIGLIVLAVMLLFGYKKLPDASRSLGSSLRIFKSEVGDLRREPTTTDETAPTPSSAGGGTRTPTPEGTRS